MNISSFLINAVCFGWRGRGFNGKRETVLNQGHLNHSEPLIDDSLATSSMFIRDCMLLPIIIRCIVWCKILLVKGEKMRKSIVEVKLLFASVECVLSILRVSYLAYCFINSTRCLPSLWPLKEPRVLYYDEWERCTIHSRTLNARVGGNRRIFVYIFKGIPQSCNCIPGKIFRKRQH